LQRTIAIEDVRVTTYPIKYDTDETNVDDAEDMGKILKAQQYFITDIFKMLILRMMPI
jgi:hypothetical protein